MNNIVICPNCKEVLYIIIKENIHNHNRKYSISPYDFISINTKIPNPSRSDNVECPLCGCGIYDEVVEAYLNR